MDPKTAYKLYRYVVKSEPISKILRKNQPSSASKSSSNKKRRNGSMSGASAAKKMKMIEDKLGLYEGVSKRRDDDSDSGSDESDAESEISDASD